MIRHLAIERTPCFGACPVYIATLDQTGTVIYDGQEYVQKEGRFSWRIPQTTIDALATYLQKVGFFSLNDAYTNMEMTCCASCIISVVLQDGGEKKVDHYDGDGSAPKKLAAIERKIETFLGLKEYIGQR